MRWLSLHRSRAGFSLIELAVVIAVLALLAGGMLTTLQAQVLNRSILQAQRQLVEARTALLGFAVAEGARLPCPDVDGDGQADPNAEPVVDVPCRGIEGALPWRTLGLVAHDPWGNVLRYRPDAGFAATAGIASPPDTLDQIEVVSAGEGRRLTLADPHAPAAVIYSCGPNRTADADNAAAPGSVACTAPRAGQRFAHGPPGAHFDDVLIWVSKNVVLGWLAMAGAWPS